MSGFEDLILQDVDWKAEIDEVPPTAGDLQAPEDFADGAWDFLTGVTQKKGVPMPWQYFNYRLQPGSLNIVLGQSGSGKSHITMQMMCHATQDGVMEKPQKALLWSAEMQNEALVARFAQLAGGTKQPKREYFDRILDYMAERIWIYKRSDRVTVDELIGIAKFAQRRLGVTMFVIDSLVKIHSPGVNAANLNLVQTDIADKLAIFARDSGMVIILVAHARKAETERSRVDKFSLKGSGGISDMASSMIAVNRNIRKAEVQKGLTGKMTKEQIDDVLAEPDTFVEVLKERATGEMPSISLYYNHATQFVDKASKTILIRELEND